MNPPCLTFDEDELAQFPCRPFQSKKQVAFYQGQLALEEDRASRVILKLTCRENFLKVLSTWRATQDPFAT